MSQLNPYYRKSGMRGNDSAVVEFLHKHECSFYEFGKQSNSRSGSPTWLENQERGAHHLVGLDRCKWDIPVRHYNTFLKLLFREPPHYTWFFVETMGDVHNMYLDFDFKCEEPVDYDKMVGVVELTCEFVHQFFSGAAEPLSYVSKCEPYLLPGKGKFKSGLHFYFKNIVTNSCHAQKCRAYVVQELTAVTDPARPDPDFDLLPRHDWDEVIDFEVFNGEPGCQRGAMRLNNTHKVEHCKNAVCKANLKAVKKFREAKEVTDATLRSRACARRRFLTTDQILAKLEIPANVSRCCTNGLHLGGSPYRPWLRVTAKGPELTTCKSSRPYTNWSMLVDKRAEMTPFDPALVVVPPVVRPAKKKPKKDGPAQEVVRQSRVNGQNRVVLCDSKAMTFLNEELIQKLRFKANPNANVCSEYKSWTTRKGVRPYQNAYVSKVVAMYDGEDKGHVVKEEKNFIFFLPLQGADQNNCYGCQHGSNQARLVLWHREKNVQMEVTCFKKDCQYRPSKRVDRVIQFKEQSPMSAVFKTLMAEAAKELGLRRCKAVVAAGLDELSLDYDKDAPVKLDWPKQ